MLKAYTSDRYVLREIIKLGEGKVKVNYTTIAKELKVCKMTISRAVGRLEKAGYLERYGRDLWLVLKDENSD